MAAATSVPIRYIDDITECPICCEVFTDPRELPCVHTYCLKCIREMCKDQQKGDNGSCPLCRREFQIPQHGGIDELPKNIFVAKLLLVKHISLSQRETKLCDICKDVRESTNNKTAKAFCLDCQMNVCDECRLPHSVIKQLRSHKLVSLQEAVKEEDLCAKYPPPYCEKHPDKYIEIYCFHCKVVLCMMCYIEDHSGHKCSDVTKVSHEFKSKFGQNLTDLNRVIHDSKKKCGTIEANGADFQKQITEAKARVCETAEHLKKLVDCHKHEILNELEEIRKNRLEEIDLFLQDVTREKAILASFEKYISELLTKGTASDLARQADSLSTRFSELMNIDDTDKLVNQLGTMEVSFQASNVIDHRASMNIVGTVVKKTIARQTTAGEIAVVKQTSEDTSGNAAEAQSITSQVLSHLRTNKLTAESSVSHADEVHQPPSQLQQHQHPLRLVNQPHQPLLCQPRPTRTYRPAVDRPLQPNFQQQQHYYSRPPSAPLQHLQFMLPELPITSSQYYPGALSPHVKSLDSSVRDFFTPSGLPGTSATGPSARMFSKMLHGVSSDQQGDQELYKKFHGILNKLTPQTFSTLMQQALDLQIDTEERLKGCVDIIFEKVAVSKAQNPMETVSLRKVLLSKCQYEFEKGWQEEMDSADAVKKMNEADSAVKRKQMADELIETEAKRKRRSLGNIRFIGELYKLTMLTEDIMHGCIARLMRSSSEHSLECLSQLLTTTGQELDNKQSKLQGRVDKCFEYLDAVVNDRNRVSARIRILMLDTIDLRKRCWVPREEEQKKLAAGLQIYVNEDRSREGETCNADLQRATERLEQLNSTFSNG